MAVDSQYASKWALHPLNRNGLGLSVAHPGEGPKHDVTEGI